MEDNAESISVVFTMRTLKKQKEKRERCKQIQTI